MKTRGLFIFFFACLSGIFLSSCKKDFSTQNNILPVQNPPVNTLLTDSNYLSKIYELEYNGSAPDTTDALIFYYDSHKRVMAVEDSSYDVSTSTYQLFSRMQFFYNGTDTVCNHYLNVVLEDPDIDSTNTYCYYDNNGIKTKDSLYNTDYASGVLFTFAHDTYTYTYAPGVRYTIDAGYEAYAAGGSTFTRTGFDTATIDGAGNRVFVRRHLQIVSNPPAGNTTDDYTESFSFDNHSNPLAKLSFYTALHNADLGGTLFFQMAISPNNLAQHAEQSYSPYTDNYTYQYNSAGYPLRATITGTHPGAFIYVYRSL